MFYVFVFGVGPACPQSTQESDKTYFPFSFPENMSDDCLYLNVWTPSLDTASKLPVMVWIYGGTHQVGNVHIFGWKKVPNDKNTTVFSS